MIKGLRFFRSPDPIYHRIGISLLVVILAVLAVFPASPVAARETFPSTIPLPNGFQPEGIAVGYGSTFYVGSIPTGAIFMGDLRTGEGSLLVQPTPGRMAIGLGFDERSGYLFVAGGPTGAAYVYNGSTGEMVAEYQFAPAGETFINDVVVTRTAAYFTSSFTPYIYRIPLGPGGELLGADFQALLLSGDYSQGEGFNANGIDATPDGKWLVVVNSALGTLYRVDPNTGYAQLIDLNGGNVINGDGIYLAGKTLYVMQNQNNQLAVVQLSPDLTSGVISNIITNPAFRVPTTIDRFGNALYAVNARLDTSPTPDTDYNLVRVQIKP